VRKTQYFDQSPDDFVSMDLYKLVVHLKGRMNGEQFSGALRKLLLHDKKY
jgi:hypothetical protein